MFFVFFSNMEQELFRKMTDIITVSSTLMGANAIILLNHDLSRILC